MKAIKISKNEYNYLKDDGTYLLDEHVFCCWDFSDGFGRVQYNDYTFNYVNSEGKSLLKNNVDNGGIFYNGFTYVSIEEYNNTVYYIIDKECNFYKDTVSFKELYYEYHDMRSELIEIIDKYTYYNIDEYFIWKE